MPARTIAFSCLLFCTTGTVLSQQTPADSILHTAIANTAQVYLQYIGNQAPIYQGPVYLDQRASFQTGSPFYKMAQPTPGSMLYNGVLYENIPLLYDVLGQKVLTTPPGSENTLLEIDLDKVAHFTIANATFVHLRQPAPGGLYEVLQEGTKSSVYMLHRKEIKEDISGPLVEKTISAHKIIYILKNGNLHKVTNRNALLKVYQDKRKELTGFLQQEKPAMKKDMASAAILAAKFYDDF
ncbi:MAG: hypothetical protein ACO1NW_01265 [Chitinophagaceae bacterium]